MAPRRSGRRDIRAYKKGDYIEVSKRELFPLFFSVNGL